MTPPRPSWTFDAVVFALCCAVAGALSLSLGQDASGDLRNYHYYDAVAAWSGRSKIDLGAAQLQTYLNPTFDIPFYLLARALPFSPRLVAFLMGLPSGVLAFLTFRIGRRLFASSATPRLLAAIATLLAASGAAGFSQLGLTTNEVPIAILVIAGLALFLRALDAPKPAAWKLLLAAGLLTGLAVGGKLTAAPYALALAGAGLAGFAPRRWFGSLVAIAIGGVVGTALTGGWWFTHLALRYGNPIFPYHNELFHSPLAPPDSYVDGRFFPRSPLQWAFYPFWWLRSNVDLVTEYPFSDPRLALAFVALLAAAVASGVSRQYRSRWLFSAATRALVAFWCVGYVFWLESFSIYRYAIPLEVVGSVLLVDAIRHAWPRRPRIVVAAAALVLAAACADTAYPDWGHIPFQARAIPFDAPTVAPGTLVLAAGDYPMAYVAAKLSLAVPVAGVFTNFVRPPDTPKTSLPVEQLIARWSGPLAVLRSRAGEPQALNALSAYYDVTVTQQCQTVRSAWDADALELCLAYKSGSGVPGYQPGTQLTFNLGGNGLRYVTSGWASPEGWGTWSLGHEAALEMKLPPTSDRIALSVDAFGLPDPEDAEAGTVLVAVDGHDVSRWRLQRSLATYQVTVPPPPDGVLRIVFHIPSPLGQGSAQPKDARPLGIALERLTVRDVP